MSIFLFEVKTFYGTKALLIYRLYRTEQMPYNDKKDSADNPQNLPFLKWSWENYQMKKILILANLIFFLSPGFLYPFESGVIIEDSQISIRSEYRRLFQGEVVKITMRSPKLSSAKAHFNGKDYRFVPARDPLTSFFLMSLGLDIKPGIHDLDIRIEFADGRKGDFSFEIPVSEGKFLSKKLNVDRRFTCPPPEAQNRIMREAKLTSEVYKEFIPHWLGNEKFIAPVMEKSKKNFGERRIFNDGFRSRHRGVDIPSPSGMPVSASNSGKVVLTRDLYFSGNTVIINHGLGFFSIYCHLSKSCVEKGRSVEKGEIIGYVGSTGRVTGPHLHWGFRLFDDYVDPLSVVYLSFD